MPRAAAGWARGALVVPAGPNTYDYYDRFLGHERRYARGELAGKARQVGLEVLLDTHIGALLYPPFWLVKQRNRHRFAHIEGEALSARVAGDIANTQDARLGALACRLEALALDAGVRFPSRDPRPHRAVPAGEPRSVIDAESST